jgi:hypothetical protein
MQTPSRLMLLLLLAYTGLTLTACGSTPQGPVAKQHFDDDVAYGGSRTLSDERYSKLRESFIGRSFILKEDWYEYSIIDSDPLGGWSDLVPVTKLADWAEDRGHRNKIASAGAFGEIVGLSTFRDSLVFICRLEPGGEAYLVVQNHRPWTITGARHMHAKSRDALKDKRITTEWVEYNLTYHTVEFVDGLPEVADTKIELPIPTQQPTLTSTANIKIAAPAIGQLNILAHPPKLRNGEVLNLIFDYTVESTGQATVLVTETRTLLLNGKVLPNYPTTSDVMRESGRYTTGFEQTIPSRAKSGTYTFTGKACIDDRCASDSNTFQVMQ